jgi:hypothetical protein
MNGDGEWLQEGLSRDQSYMAKDSTILSSVGVVIHCHVTNNWFKGTVAKVSTTASNYCWELSGAVVTSLLLCTASCCLVPPFPKIGVLCNNQGVILHSNSPLTLLTEKQKQADLSRLIKYLSSTNCCRRTWKRVKGHTVDCKGRQHCTLLERLNNQADKLAKIVLVLSVAGGHMIEGNLTFELVHFSLSGKKVSGSP